MAYITSRKHAVTRNALNAAATTLMTGLALAQPALAADTPAGSGDATTTPKTLDGVQVQASTTSDYKVDNLSSSKYTQPILDTTQTVSVISKDLFLQQGATTLTEALRNTPGVGTFYVGENGTTSTGDAIYMRGFDTSGSIFVDGVRDLGTISRDVFNTESVEVIKGPASTDNGRTAPTGAINMVSKQPELGNGISASLAYGSANQRRITADWNQAVSNTAAFRLNVMGQDFGVPGRDKVENNRWGVAPEFAFGLGTATRVYLDYLHIKQNNVPDGGVPTIGLPGYSSPDPTRSFLGTAREVDSSNFYGTTADHDHVTADMFTARIEHDVNDQLTVRNTLRWGRTFEDYLLTSFMGTAANLRTPNPNDPSTWTIARSNPTFKHQANTILTDQANVTYNFDTGAITHNLSSGIELTREKATTIGYVALNGTTWPAANLYDPNWDVKGLIYGQNGAYTDGKTDTASAYVFDTLKFGPHWQVNAGVRMDHYDTDYASAVACGGKSGPACGTLATGSVVPGLTTQVSDNLWNWKLGVLYKPVPNGSVYINYAVSAEPPGGNTLTLSSSSNSLDNPNLQPERARTYEVGTKWDLLDDKLLLTGALYQTTVSNDLVQDPVTLLYYQIGKKRVQGVELSAVGKLTENWAVSAGFTTMNASVLSGSAVAQDGSSDLAYTPKKAFTSWTSYLLPFGLTIGGGARYNGEMLRGTDSAIGTPAYTKAYWVFDAMASYPINKNIDVSLNLYNLFDKDYVAAINKSGYRYTPGTPRSAMITANVRF
ncbi:catecholate siderophore receptor [Dyella jiangningensis]|uniref:catecholate siderophore receptor Fiu n=1 Tax=Dyella sp. AtDHG13 TaxID=1938897 RepID=UPI000884C20A|nr:catecholate siderophore receptor Fiu [Dyella sp. AtDHG13]PXV58347.1 catecholate siderophore receptor [Dyella sp. AtDHG13]SDK06149.1 catecholate siderophore receptor [Dyella jiangningensis]